jgi:transposase
MKKHKLFKPSKILVETLRGETQREHLLHRLHSVLLVQHGFSSVQAAKMFNDSPRALAYWVKRYEADGIAGLEDKTKPGRPPRLTAAQTKRLHTFVTQKKPTSARVVSDFLLSKFGVSLTPRQCMRILKRFRE